METHLGTEDLGSILAIEGVDAFFTGTSDLSLEYGYPSPSAPEMMQRLKAIPNQVTAVGKVYGVHMVTWKATAPMLALGVRYFTVSALAVMGSALRQCHQDFLREIQAAA